MIYINFVNMHEAFIHVLERILVHTKLIKLKTDAWDL